MGPKDLGNQQSRFKWMMEGQTSPDTASPDNAFHKNGWLPFPLENCVQSIKERQHI